MTISWSDRAAMAENEAREMRAQAALMPMRTYERKKAFAVAQGLERIAAAYRARSNAS